MVDDKGVRWVNPGRHVITAGDVAAPATHDRTVTGTRQQASASCSV